MDGNSLCIIQQLFVLSLLRVSFCSCVLHVCAYLRCFSPNKLPQFFGMNERKITQIKFWFYFPARPGAGHITRPGGQIALRTSTAVLYVRPSVCLSDHNDGSSAVSRLSVWITGGKVRAAISGAIAFRSCRPLNTARPAVHSHFSLAPARCPSRVRPSGARSLIYFHA